MRSKFIATFYDHLVEFLIDNHRELFLYDT